MNAQGRKEIAKYIVSLEEIKDKLETMRSEEEDKFDNGMKACRKVSVAKPCRKLSRISKAQPTCFKKQLTLWKILQTSKYSLNP